MVLFFHFSDILLFPFYLHNMSYCDGCQDTSTIYSMKIMGVVLMLWWLSQTIVIFFLSDNSRISQGRFFIRYSFEFEIMILIIILLNRLSRNILDGEVTQFKILLNFILYLLQLFKVKWGDGIVHPLTRKYFLLFTILPIWFVICQFMSVVSAKYMKNAFLVFFVCFVFFLGIYFFKTDEFNMELVSLVKNENIHNPRKLLVKLDTLLVLLREDFLGDEKSSVLLEGVLRQYQEYASGEEVELLNNFEKKETKDKEGFFKKRRSAILRLISLYYMKGISQHTDFPELRFSFVYFMFDFLNLRNQAVQFLTEMQGHDMKSVDFFKWIIVKSEIEAEMLKKDDESKKTKSSLSKSNQKIKYDQLVYEIEKTLVKMMEFWRAVSEENTKVRSIADLLNKLTRGLVDLEDYWKRERKHLENIPKCQIIYGIFLKEIVNKAEEGEELIRHAFEELDKQKLINQNFKEIDFSSNINDLEKAVAFIKITSRAKDCFIENCTTTFAKYLYSQKIHVIGTPLNEFLPPELSSQFITYLVKSDVLKDNENESTSIRSSLRFPFLTYYSKFLKEFFFEHKIIINSNNEPILALNLKLDNDFSAFKFILDVNSGQVKYMNPKFFADYDHKNHNPDETHIKIEELKIENLVDFFNSSFLDKY